MTNSTHLFLILKGFPFHEVIAKYASMRVLLEITGRKKNNFTQLELSTRKELLDEYQSMLHIMRTMSIAKEQFDIEGYARKSWAIEKYHNFVRRRNKYGI